MEESVQNGHNRQPDGTFGPGNIANPNGRPIGSKDNPEKKVLKQLIEEYRERLADSLEKLDPVLLAEALKGNVQAIKEVHEVVGSHAPKKTDITTDGKPLTISFDESFNKNAPSPQ